MTEAEQIGHLGHRERVQEKFLKLTDMDVMPDYEFLELILMKSIPRLDVKPLAKALLARFGSLLAVMTASEEELTTFKHLKKSTVVLFKIILETNRRLLLEKIKEKPIIEEWDDLVDYCCMVLQNSRLENCMVLYLNGRLNLIRRDILNTGTSDRVFFYPKEILKQALLLGANSVVIVHNHPSGSVEPSKQDLLLTAALQKILRAGGIQLLDHLIIGTGRRVYSFTNHGHLAVLAGEPTPNNADE